MSSADSTSIANATPCLFDEPILPEAAVPAEVIPTDQSGQVLASDPDSDADELDESGGLRDVDSPLPDNWQGPGIGGDELDDVVREAEHFPSTDQSHEEEPPREETEPDLGWAWPTASARTVQSVQFVVMWPRALGNPERIPPSVVAARAADITAMGQVRPCRGRWLETGHVEIVTGVLDYLAVRSIAEAGGEPWGLIVDVEP